MERPKFKWCRLTIEQIRFKPDRDKVWNELMAHIEDRCEAMAAYGIPEEEAERRAVAAMGDPAEVGKQLDSVHKPWLGWLWVVSKVLVILLLIVALTLVPGTVRDYKHELEDSYEEEWMGFREENMPQNTYCADLYDLDLAAEVDGYRFIVDKVAWWRGDDGGSIQLYIQMDIIRPLFQEPVERSVIENFYIEDDQGLCVGAEDFRPENYDPAIGLYGRGIGYDQVRVGNPFLGECLLAFSAFVWEPEWVDLRYEHEGRTMTFRIPGPGGESA